jgi:hypothetical protein
LPGEATSESERLLTRLGAELVPLSGDAIAVRARAAAVRQRVAPLDAASLAETLSLMRHPVR